MGQVEDLSEKEYSPLLTEYEKGERKELRTTEVSSLGKWMVTPLTKSRNLEDKSVLFIQVGNK